MSNLIHVPRARRARFYQKVAYAILFGCIAQLSAVAQRHTFNAICIVLICALLRLLISLA